MSTTVTYKGSTLTTVENATKTLATSGKYMEGDVIITDTTSGGGSVIITEETDAGGGIIKHITANNTIDLSNDTVDAAHLAQGYTAHDKSGAAIIGTMTGGVGEDVASDFVFSGCTPVFVHKCVANGHTYISLLATYEANTTFQIWSNLWSMVYTNFFPYGVMAEPNMNLDILQNDSTDNPIFLSSDNRFEVSGAPAFNYNGYICMIFEANYVG